MVSNHGHTIIYNQFTVKQFPNESATIAKLIAEKNVSRKKLLLFRCLFSIPKNVNKYQALFPRFHNKAVGAKQEYHREKSNDNCT